MGCKELIESLRAAGDEKIRAMQQEEEREAGKIRAEVAEKIGQLRKVRNETHVIEAAEKTSTALSEAAHRARLIRLVAEKALAERLYSLALASLQQLRNAGYRAVFAALARELPHFAWKTVRVNPIDRALAQEHFPEAELVPDNTIAGGMDVTSDEGKVRVVNTFEKRLERSWDEMLPTLLRDVYDEAAHHGTP